MTASVRPAGYGAAGSGPWRAAVDIGTVSAKMLLTDGRHRIRHSVDTMLGGSALSAVGEVRSEAMGEVGLGRLDGALAHFAQLIEATTGVPPAGIGARAVATAPGRFAANADALADAVRRHLGVELEVVDAATEGRLSFIGAVSDRGPTTGSSGPGPSSPTAAGPAAGRLVTIDIGGGSTELAAGTADGVEHVFSMPIGGRSVTAAYLGADPPRPEELSAALSVVELHVDDVRREAPGLVADLDSAVVLGLGAVVTVAAVEIGLADGDPNSGEGDGPLHGVALTRAGVEEVFRTLATERRADRIHNPGLPPTRVDEIVGATAVLVEIMRQLALDRLVVSQRGLLDGLLVSSPGS